MALKVSDECISCGACILEFPVEAIFEGADHTEIDAEKCVECDKSTMQSTVPGWYY